MAIFLKILAITGIVLLSILAFILLIFLIVLFVPVRYSAKGKFEDNKLSLSAQITWLLRFVGIKFVLDQENPLSVRILFFKLNLSKEKPQKAKKEKKPKKKKNKDKEARDEKPPTTVLDPQTDQNIEPVEETVSEAVVTEEPVEETISEPTYDIKAESISEFSNEMHDDDSSDSNIKTQKIKKDKDTTKVSACAKIKKYLEIIQTKRFKRTFSYCKKKLGKLLKAVLPRKWELNALVGFDDPSVTGNILVYSSMLYPFIAKHIHIKGDFEHEVIRADFKLKGHITFFKIALIALQVYLNRDIKKLIKMFKEA